MKISIIISHVNIINNNSFKNDKYFSCKYKFIENMRKTSLV